MLFLAASAAWGANVPADANATPKIGPPSDWVQPTPWQPPTQLVPNPTGQDFLLLDQQNKMELGESYQHTVYQVVSEHGREDASQVYFHFDPSYQSLTIHQLKLIRGDTTVDRLDPAKIQVLQQERDLDRQLYNGTRSALVILDDVRVGDIIDMAYTVRGANPVFGRNFIDTQSFGWSMPVREQHYRLLVPADRTINAKIIGSPDIVPTTVTRGGEKDMSWVRTNIPILESEDRTPSTEYIYPFLEISEFRSWKDVVDWALPLYAVDNTPSPLVDALVAKLRTGANSNEQRIIDALAFVQQEIRYLGIEMGAGSHRPSEPEEVLRRRFGDCKDKARLLATLLQRLGLDAAPALVNSFRRDAIRARLSSPYAFDHVIVALDLGPKRYLLDPTLSYQRGDGLALRHVGRYSVYLRIAPGSVVNLENAEPGVADTQRTDLTQEFECPSFDQPATLTVTSTATGRAADNLRAYFATHTIDQINREYLDYYTRYYSNISRAQSVEFSDQPRSNTVKVTEHYKIDRLFTRTERDGVLRASFQPANIWEYARTANLGERRWPYSIAHPVKFNEHLVIKLPEDWIITSEKEDVEDPAFRLHYEVKLPDPRTLILDYNWESRAFAVPVARLQQFSTQLKAARGRMGYELTWKTEPKPAPAPAPVVPVVSSSQFNWPMIGLAAGICAAGGYAGWRLIRRKNPAAIPPLLSDAPPPLESAVAHDLYSQAEREKLEGIGGWLIMVAIGIVLRPIFWVYTLAQSLKAFFDQRIWNVLTDPASSTYNKNFALVAPLEMAFELVLMLYSLLLVALFFRKSHLFPRAIQIYLGLAVVFTVFGLWDNDMLGQKLGYANYVLVFQTAAVSAIWIPYFQLSRRVSATFTR